MDSLIIVYAILTAILSAIMAEEVRDLHYFPLIASIGLALAGTVLVGTSSLIPPASATALIILLAAASTLTALAFFYDLRKITAIERDARICENKARELLDFNSSLYSSAANLQNECVRLATALTQISEDTAKGIEAIHIG